MGLLKVRLGSPTVNHNVKKMNIKIKAMFLGAYMTLSTNQQVSAGILDSLFPPEPYKSESEAITDLKEYLKYSNQCTWVACNTPQSDNYLGKPIPSCEKMGDARDAFNKRFEISTRKMKESEHIQWYLEKVRENSRIMFEMCVD